MLQYVKAVLKNNVEGCHLLVYGSTKRKKIFAVGLNIDKDFLNFRMASRNKWIFRDAGTTGFFEMPEQWILRDAGTTGFFEMPEQKDPSRCQNKWILRGAGITGFFEMLNIPVSRLRFVFWEPELTC